jgi:hypothetical protein
VTKASSKQVAAAEAAEGHNKDTYKAVAKHRANLTYELTELGYPSDHETPELDWDPEAFVAKWAELKSYETTVYGPANDKYRKLRELAKETTENVECLRIELRAARTALMSHCS